MPFRIQWTARPLIVDGSGMVHEIPEIFLRFEQERSVVSGIEDLMDNRRPEKIGEKIRDGIPLRTLRSGQRGMARIPFQTDEEMVEIAKFPTRFQANAVLGGTFNLLFQSKSIKQKREIHSRMDRQIQGTPESCVDLDQLGPILCGVPLELDHRDPVPVIEGYQSGGCFERLDGWADAFAKNANPP